MHVVAKVDKNQLLYVGAIDDHPQHLTKQFQELFD